MIELLTSIFSSKLLLWVTAIVLGIYTYLRYVVYNYWEKEKVPHDPPSIPLGNLPLDTVLGKFSIGKFKLFIKKI